MQEVLRRRKTTTVVRQQKALQRNGLYPVGKVRFRAKRDHGAFLSGIDKFILDQRQGTGILMIVCWLSVWNGEPSSGVAISVLVEMTIKDKLRIKSQLAVDTLSPSRNMAK
jgi:hypothetical protein